MSGSYKKLLVLPNIHIHNANALSSPFTIGFPAMTAWLGATHALQRKLNQKGMDVIFSATGVVSHAIDLQTYRGNNDYVASIIGTANPLDKTGTRSAFIEEARCHLQVSLVIECEGLDYQLHDKLIQHINHILHASMKIAGGDIQQFDQASICVVESDNSDDPAFKGLIRKLMPGYVLIDRRDLMIEAMEQGQDAMDALIDYLAIHHSVEETENGEVIWKSKRRTTYDNLKDIWVPAGWVVPIATGFQGISDLAEAKNQRDSSAPHCFAESVVTLGEFKMPYRFTSVDDMLWRYHYDEGQKLYQCQALTHHQPASESPDDEFA